MEEFMCVEECGIEVEQISQLAKSELARLKRFLSRFEHNEDDVDDIIQDTLVEALSSVGRAQIRTSARAWFYGVAANVARHHVAKRVKIATLTVSIHSLFEADAAGDALGEHLQQSIDEHCPYRAAEFSQVAERLSSAIAKMPVDLRGAFELACIQELPYQQVAVTLCVPVGTIRSRVHRARAILRQSINREESLKYQKTQNFVSPPRC
jgi:RNA polymerase sigma factor (sigma-70 family)